MAESFLLYVNPAKLEALSRDHTPALDDDVGQTEGLDELRDAARSEQRARIEELVGLLPDEDRDTIELTLRGLSQATIGTVLGMTQEGVSYRLIRAEARLRWLIATDYTSYDAAQMREDLRRILPTRRVEVLVHWYATTSQTEAARAVGLDISTAHDWIRRSMQVIAGAGEDYAKYARLFAAIKAQPNMRQALPTHVMRGRSYGGTRAKVKRRAKV